MLPVHLYSTPKYPIWILLKIDKNNNNHKKIKITNTTNDTTKKFQNKKIPIKPKQRTTSMTTTNKQNKQPKFHRIQKRDKEPQRTCTHTPVLPWQRLCASNSGPYLGSQDAAFRADTARSRTWCSCQQRSYRLSHWSNLRERKRVCPSDTKIGL